MINYKLTVFTETVDVNNEENEVYFTCTTDRTGLNPFLEFPDSFSKSTVSLLNGKGSIGQLNAKVLDKRINAVDKNSGWLTAKLANDKGYSALMGRRMKMEIVENGQSSIVFFGVIRDVTLDGETLVYYNFSFRDIRDRERKAKAFSVANTASVFPAGVINGYGKPLVAGTNSTFNYLIPPTSPWLAKFKTTSTPGYSYFDMQSYAYSFTDSTSNHSYEDRKVKDPRVILKANQYKLFDKTALRSTGLVDDGVGKKEEQYYQVYTDIQIWWRVPGTENWTVIDQPEKFYDEQIATNTLETENTYRKHWGYPVVISEGRFKDRETGDYNRVEVGYRISVAKIYTTPTLPANNQMVEVMIVHCGTPTDDYPYHIESNLSQFLPDFFSGKYSTYDPKLYFGGLVGDFDIPIRARITAPVEDMKKWAEENLLQPVNAFPVTNYQDGKTYAVRYELPTSDGPALVELNDNNCRELSASWDHTTDETVNYVEFEYIRDIYVPAEYDYKGEYAAGDMLMERKVVYKNLDLPSIDLLDEQKLSIKPETIRSNGSFYTTAQNSMEGEIGESLAKKFFSAAVERFKYGSQRVNCQIKRDVAKDIKAGQFVLCAMSWLPDYITKRRGLNRLMQVVGINDVDFNWTEISLSDCGPAPQPSVQPTNLEIEVDVDYIVTAKVDILLTPSADIMRVRFDYAIANSEPALNDAKWQTIALQELTTDVLVNTTVTNSVRFGPLPDGARVWVRARTQAAVNMDGSLRLASAWTPPEFLDINTYPAVIKSNFFVADNNSDLLIDAQGNASTNSLRIYYAEYPTGTAQPEPVLYFDVNNATQIDDYVLPIAQVFGQDYVILIEAWNSNTPGEIGALASARVRHVLSASAFKALNILYDVDTIELVAGISQSVRVTIKQDPDNLVAGVLYNMIPPDRVKLLNLPPTSHVGKVYNFEVILDEKQNIIVEPIIVLSGGYASLRSSVTLMGNEAAQILNTSIAYQNEIATVSIEADADTTKVYYAELIAGVEQTPVLAFTGRSGTFVVTASQTERRRFNVFGRNRGNLRGPNTYIEINAYAVPIVDPDINIIVLSSTDSTITYTATASNPKNGNTVTLEARLIGVNAVITKSYGPPSPINRTPSSSWFTVYGDDIIAVARPDFLAGQGSIEFRATIDSANTFTVAREVVPKQKDTANPTIEVQLLNTETIRLYDSGVVTNGLVALWNPNDTITAGVNYIVDEVSGKNMFLSGSYTRNVTGDYITYNDAIAELLASNLTIPLNTFSIVSVSRGGITSQTNQTIFAGKGQLYEANGTGLNYMYYNTANTAVNTVPQGTWLITALTYLKSSSQKIYLNGVIKANDTTSSSKNNDVPNGTVSTAQKFIIGAQLNTLAGAQRFRGDIGPVLIYNRELTAAEVVTNQNAIVSYAQSLGYAYQSLPTVGTPTPTLVNSRFNTKVLATAYSNTAADSVTLQYQTSTNAFDTTNQVIGTPTATKTFFVNRSSDSVQDRTLRLRATSSNGKVTHHTIVIDYMRRPEISSATISQSGNDYILNATFDDNTFSYYLVVTGGLTINNAGTPVTSIAEDTPNVSKSVQWTIQGTATGTLTLIPYTSPGQIGSAGPSFLQTLTPTTGTRDATTYLRGDGVYTTFPTTMKKFAQDIGNGTATSYVITHNLATYDLQYTIFSNSGTRENIVATVQRTSLNTATVIFSVAPATNAYRIILTA